MVAPRHEVQTGAGGAPVRDTPTEPTASSVPAGLVRITRLGHTLLGTPIQVVAVSRSTVRLLAATPTDADAVPARIARRFATAEGPTTVDAADGVTWSGAAVGLWGRSVRVCLCTVAVPDGGRTRAVLADLAALARDVLRLDAAEDEADMLRELLGTASHDLRNPLSVLRAGLETLALHPDDLPPGMSERIAELAVRQARRMGVLLDGLLSLHGLEGQVDHVAVDLRELVADALEAARLSHELVQLAPDGPLPDTPVTVRGEPDSLARVLTNLVSNAAVHGGGRVWVGLTVDGDTACLTVADDGPGMPEDVEFDPASRPRRAGGHGLGTVIARRIVNAHEGEISHRPRPGGGTIVEICLPLARA